MKALRAPAATQQLNTALALFHPRLWRPAAAKSFVKQASGIRSLAGFGEWFWRERNQKPQSLEAGRQAFFGPLGMKSVEVVSPLLPTSRTGENHRVNDAEQPVRDGHARVKLQEFCKMFRAMLILIAFR
jgi:hypothetical protein